MSAQDELEEEMRGYVRALSADDWEELVAAGVKPLDILVHHMVGAARIRLTEDGRWEPATAEERGARIFVTPVRAHEGAAAYDIESPRPREDALEGTLVDIVAWHPARPEGWSLRTGDAIVLGGTQLRLSDEAEIAVKVHRGPLAWLRSDTDGIVLLTKDVDEQRRLMMGVRRIVADDREHATAIRRALEPVYRPPVIALAQEPAAELAETPKNVVRLVR